MKRDEVEGTCVGINIALALGEAYYHHLSHQI